MAENSESEKDKEKYVSKDGFEKVKVIRGFTEIKNLFEDLKPFKCFICGGYVRYMASPRWVPAIAGDVDIYCESLEEAEKVKKFMADNKLEIKYENNISITYKTIKEYEHRWFGSPTIQLIKPVEEGRVVSVGDMEKILSNFDFTVIRAGLLSETEVLADADFLHDERRCFLRLKNIHCPISSTLRCIKYGRKGYWLPPTQALKLFLDWEERDADYREKIRDFITKANEGKGLSKEEVEDLEKLMRID